MKFYNRVLANFLLPLGDALLGTSFMKDLVQLRRVVKLTEDQLESLQKRKLEALLEHAQGHSAYYRNLCVTRDKDPIVWLKKFPVLTKSIIKENTEHILTAPINKLFKHGSSGSSGIQTTVYWSKKEQNLNRATQILWWEWAGFELGDPILQTGINPSRTLLKRLKDFFFRTYYLQAFSHKKEDVQEALQWASKRKNVFLAGYASSIYVLAKIAETEGVAVRFKASISWGDKLFSHYRNLIDKVFSVKIRETYASAEGLMIAAQKDLDFMYIMTPNVFIEIVDDHGKEVADGEMGHVLITNLNAFAMPLIRYKIGDLAMKLPIERYPAEREYNLPLLERVIGRDTDLVKTASGKYMVVHSFTGIFEHIPQIRQFKIIQNDLNGIIIEYIPAADFKKDILTSIERKILRSLQEDFKIEFKEVDHIQPSPSGKPQIIKSDVVN